MKIFRSIVHLLFLLLSYLQGQGQQISCGADEILKQNAALKLQLLKLENERQKAGVQSLDMTTVYTIPVVFHVYHLGEAVGTGSNVSDAAIQDIVAGMNSAFRAQNYFASGNDVKIQFALASYTSNCQSTNGIVRVDARSVPNYQTNGCGISDYQIQNDLRNLSSWDANSYINVRIVHNMPTFSGFAWFLGDIFCTASTVNANPSGSLSAFWAHEMGHSLNLYHTFEGDGGNQYCPPNSNPETEGDRISDTDPHKQNDGCNYAAINSCTNMPFGDVLKNIMSYSCSDRFTPKQIERMRYALINYRTSLINSIGLTGSPTISSTTSASRCGTGTVMLSASGCNGTYNWYAAASGGSSLGTGADFTTPSISVTTPYYVDCTVGSCVSGRTSATASIIIIPMPTVNSPTINSGQTATLTASNCSGSVKWYNQQTSGTVLFTGNPYTTSTLTTTATYYASCTVNNCESSRGSGTVTVTTGCTPPAVPNVPATNIGMVTSVTLNYSNACVGGTLKWYDAQTGGNLLSTGGTYTTPMIYATTYYYISCTINSCESARGQLTINYTPLPCVGNQNSSGNYGTANIQTNGTITTTATILSGARTNFFAGQSVTLNPGFKTSTSSIFRAEIQNCVSNSGLIAYYPFNGNANDESGNVNHGIVTGATLNADRFGNASKAYRFADGNNIRVPNSNSLNLPNTFTFSVWVNMQSTTGRDGNGNMTAYGNHTIFAKDCDYGKLSWGISPQSNGTFVSLVWAGNNGDYPTISFQLNQWRHLCITYDGSTLRQYVNGLSVSAKAVTNNFAATNANDLYIGKIGCYSYFFNGILDDIRIYNRALTNAEVQSIYAIER